VVDLHVRETQHPAPVPVSFVPVAAQTFQDAARGSASALGGYPLHICPDYVGQRRSSVRTDTVSHPVLFESLSRFGVADFCFYTSHVVIRFPNQSLQRRAGSRLSCNRYLSVPPSLSSSVRHLCPQQLPAPSAFGQTVVQRNRQRLLPTSFLAPVPSRKSLRLQRWRLPQKGRPRPRLVCEVCSLMPNNSMQTNRRPAGQSRASGFSMFSGLSKWRCRGGR